VSRPRPSVAVIGGGLFGASAAIALAREFRVSLFERSGRLFSEASGRNHGRDHRGYHYPRSDETAQECQRAKAEFERRFGSAIVRDVPTFYLVAGGGRTTADAFARFCDRNQLPYVERWPPTGAVARDPLEASFAVEEPVYDLRQLRRLVQRGLLLAGVDVRLRHTVERVELEGESARKRLLVRDPAHEYGESFDFLVSATYVSHNALFKWLGQTPRELQFNLQETCVVRFPKADPIALTVVDGAYPSLLPFGRSGYHLLAHVSLSRRRRETSVRHRSLLSDGLPSRSAAAILSESAHLLPILSGANLVTSFLIDRVVVEAPDTDRRISEVTHHGHGCWSILAGKMVTAIEVGQSVAAAVRDAAGARAP
jgi:hypothetical protein